MTINKLRMLKAITLTLGFSVSAADAQPITLTFQQGDGYTGCLDTTLVSNPCDAPETPHGNDPSVGIDCCDSNPTCDPDLTNLSCPDHGLLWFDGIFGDALNQIPFGSRIISASIQLKDNGGDPAGGLVVTNVHRMLLEWTEDDTWCQWGNGIQAHDSEAANTADATIPPVSSGMLVTVDVTTSLQEWSDGATNYGWAFLPASDDNNGWAFYSCDASESNRPLLEVTFEPVGVCCKSAGTVCEDNGTEANCIKQGGTYAGDGSVCTTPTACCFQDNTCEDLAPVCCGVRDGVLHRKRACGVDEDQNGIDDVCEEEPIPTVSEWSLIVMALLALAAGTVVLMRRRRSGV